MEARFLVDDLRLLPKDSPESAPARAEAADVPPAAEEPLAAEHAAGEETEQGAGQPEGEPPASAQGGVTVSVDTLMRPGAMVSGKVRFSDGQTAQWYLDQFGRMGMVPPSPGYRPPQQDIPQFQVLLDKELTRMGM